MSDIAIHHASKRFGATRALDEVSLAVPSGELLAVLGPSGCGKTTLLRCIAGFERLDRGRIDLGGTQVAGRGVHLPSHRRQVAVVPQEGALFPHLSLSGNVGFGLSRQRRRARVEECLELVGLAGLGQRMPHELSGGQQQRAAVARAIAPRPPLILLDEPFSALDAALRTEVRRDVRAALIEDGATAILVTHDQSEALSMADRIAVMRGGRILQEGTPASIYREPVDPWVAGFVGEAVLIPVHHSMSPGGAEAAAPGRTVVRTALGDLEGIAVADATSDVLDAAAEPDGRVAMVRPEQLTIGSSPEAGVPATVRGLTYHGHDALVSLALGDGTPVLVRVLDGPLTTLTSGATVQVCVNGSVRVYDHAGSRAEPAPVAPGMGSTDLGD